MVRKHVADTSSELVSTNGFIKQALPLYRTLWHITYTIVLVNHWYHRANMSIHLQDQASPQSTILYNARRQFHGIPPVPADTNLLGKTALITGSNVGLGLECARHFLKLRASRLIMAVRSLSKGEAAAARLRAEFPAARIEVWQLDMESFRSVQAFAARCDRDLDRLHVAVLNAGLARLAFERVREGKRRETTVQVNYLATALLAVLLIPKLRPSGSAPGAGRLTIITSDSALRATVPVPEDGGILDWVDDPKNFDSFAQYARSKLLISAFAARLAEEIDPKEVIVNSSNPASTKGTAFFRDVDHWFLNMAVGLMQGVLARTAAEGARIYVHSSLVLGKESHGSFTDWAVRP